MSRKSTLLALATVLALEGGTAANSDADPAADENAFGEELRDFDQDQEEFSEFWERALTPNRELYERLVARARLSGIEGSSSQYARSRDLFADAIRLEPSNPRAYWELGMLHKHHMKWKECVDTLEQVAALDPRFRTGANDQGNLDGALGSCLAQSGKYREAISRFKRILGRGSSGSRSQVYRVTGESFMALGKLVRAIEYFELALRLETRVDPTSNYLLAVAHDRDERSALAHRHLEAALKRDPKLSKLSSRSSFIPNEDRYYYLGLAHSGKNAAWALIYFRHFLALSEGSPWRARAVQHLAEAITTLERAPPISVRGKAQIDERRMRSALSRYDETLAACVSETPEILLRVKLKRLIATARNSSGVTVVVDYVFALSTPTVEQVVSCVDRVASEISLPPISGPAGSHATVEFHVVSLRQ